MRIGFIDAKRVIKQIKESKDWICDLKEIRNHPKWCWKAFRSLGKFWEKV